MTDQLLESVQSRYAAVANSTLSNKDAGVKAVAEAFGYSPEQLSSIPAEANMGLSCGNPTAMASIRAGEVIVDLGSGGGLDVFLASELVGPQGRAIGIDMTPAMIDRARANALAGGYHAGIDCCLEASLTLAPERNGFSCFQNSKRTESWS
jgi:arsenite methyltransferase